MEAKETILEKLENLERLALLNKSVLNFEEVSVYTGLSKSTLYKLTSGKIIPHYKPSGKLLYFDRKELDSWLLQNRVPTTEEIHQQAVEYCYNEKGGKK